MKIKCRGYSGTLLEILAAKRATIAGVNIIWYNIKMRAPDGAEIKLFKVDENEIDITTE